MVIGNRGSGIGIWSRDFGDGAWNYIFEHNTFSGKTRLLIYMIIYSCSFIKRMLSFYKKNEIAVFLSILN